MAVAASQAAALAAAASQAVANLSLADEYAELLSSEVIMDVPRLRDLARHFGVPPQFRGEVWKYLLGVAPSDRSHELTTARARAQAYETMCAAAMSSHLLGDAAKQVRGEVNRYLRRVPAFAQLAGAVGPDVVRGVFERVISTYLANHMDAVCTPSRWVHVLAPFVVSVRDEPDVYACFDTMMTRIDAQFADRPLALAMADVMAMLRSVLPDLWNFLDEEEVDVREWLASWLASALACEMPLDSLLCLWDSYLAEPAGLDLHPFVCLASLHQLKESLEDLEASEIMAMLRRLPFKPAEVDTIVNLAKNLRLEARQGDAVLMSPSAHRAASR